ncbi:Fc.00g010560.m01.CDS01 [Cosmosporella sp. VM-42]
MASTSESSRPIEDLAKKLQHVLLGDPFKKLMLVVEQNSELREDNERFQGAYSQHCKTVSRLQQQLDDQTHQLEETTNRIKRFQDSLVAAKKATGDKVKELERSKKEALRLRSNLDQVRPFVFKMKQAEEETMYAIPPTFSLLITHYDGSRKQLNDIFEAIYTLVDDCLGGSLEEAVLTNSSNWNKIRRHESVDDIIPLPLTNSAMAKQMRIAAILAICANALSRHVFQSTYILKTSNELSNLMTELSEVGREQELFLRSVLLSVWSDKQRENGRIWADQAVTDVVSNVKSILPKARLEDFASSLKNIYRNACDTWLHLQQLDGKVESVMYMSEEAGWVALFSALPVNKVQGQKSNGDRPADGDSEQPVQAQPLSKGDGKDAVAIIWPAFLFRTIKDGSVRILRDGLVLQEEQIRAGRDEEAAMLMQGTRRMARLNRRSRTLSMSAKSDDKNAERAFLTSGNGDGEGGA